MLGAALMIAGLGEQFASYNLHFRCGNRQIVIIVLPPVIGLHYVEDGSYDYPSQDDSIAALNSCSDSVNTSSILDGRGFKSSSFV